MDNQYRIQDEEFNINFQNIPQSNSSNIIKVIGVGGGGGNAVNHMYREGIHDVSYVVCNTDSKALEDSPIPTKLQMGEGLGAGNKPEMGRAKAIESIDQIKQMLSDGTRMVFITAGMGGGTGTGAAPIVAQTAKEMGILTVGIVTIPFKFEGNKKIDQALDGVREMSKHVDALLVINNERLREVFPELTFINAFARADDTLSIAAKSISEIITMRGIMNLDFQDVKTVLKDGGVALMSTGFGEGENRVTKAIEEAIKSPLLNNNDIFNSKKLLLNINFAAESEDQELTMEEMTEIHDFMARFRTEVEVKWGVATDPTLGSKVKITLLATGFGMKNVPGMEEKEENEKEVDEAMAAEIQEQKEILRDHYYGKDKTTQRRHTHIYIFTPNDLDNDDIISSIESTPTYSRTRAELEQIKNNVQKGVTLVTPNEEPDNNTKIVF